jgi:hypothetical protein
MRQWSRPSAYVTSSRAEHGGVVPQAPKVKPRTIVCPSCGAAIGAACVNAAGKETSFHEPRRRMVIRAMNELRENTSGTGSNPL